MQPVDNFIFNSSSAASLGSLLHFKMYTGKILPGTQLPSSQQEDFCDPSPPHCVGIQYSRFILFWFFFSSLWILLLAIPVMSISLGESRLASNLLCSQEWPWSPDPPAFMLTLQACAATPSPVIKLNRKKIEIYNILNVVHNPFPQGLILSRNGRCLLTSILGASTPTVDLPLSISRLFPTRGSLCCSHWVLAKLNNPCNWQYRESWLSGQAIQVVVTQQHL